MSIREILERKKREDGDSWLHDKDVNNVIRKFAKIQEDNKYFYS